MSSKVSRRLAVQGIAYNIEGELVLSHISFTIKAGEVCCLLGPSGCGKTTLLKLIAGLLCPDKGSIYLGDQNITRVNGSLRHDSHPAIMVFQDLGLFPHMNIAENVAYGLKVNTRERKQKVEKMLALLDLEGMSYRYPHELSGGQQQRIALARALVLEPKILLLDEPFANLDMVLRQSLAEEILALLRQRDIITLMVTHDREDALAFGDYVGVMGEGKILQWDTPRQLILQPATPDVARFTGHNSVITGVTQDNGIAKTILGTVTIDEKNQIPDKNSIVDVLLRCSDARVTFNQHMQKAMVIYRCLEAEQLIYTLKLDNGEFIYALADNLTQLKIGESTHVELINHKLAVYF